MQILSVSTLQVALSSSQPSRRTTTRDTFLSVVNPNQFNPFLPYSPLVVILKDAFVLFIMLQSVGRRLLRVPRGAVATVTSSSYTTRAPSQQQQQQHLQIPPSSRQATPLRSFASLAETVQKQNNNVRKSKPLVNVRKQLWEFYLSTGRGANALFEAIDIDENGAVDPQELKVFMMDVLVDADGEPIDPKELMPYAWNRLEQREAAGQPYDSRAFKKWLVAATKMSADMKNSRMLEYLAQNPNTGDQWFSDVEEEDIFTWNEETMSQVRRRSFFGFDIHCLSVPKRLEIMIVSSRFGECNMP